MHEFLQAGPYRQPNKWGCAAHASMKNKKGNRAQYDSSTKILASAVAEWFTLSAQ